MISCLFAISCVKCFFLLKTRKRIIFTYNSAGFIVVQVHFFTKWSSTFTGVNKFTRKCKTKSNIVTTSTCARDQYKIGLTKELKLCNFIGAIIEFWLMFTSCTLIVFYFYLFVSSKILTPFPIAYSNHLSAHVAIHLRWTRLMTVVTCTRFNWSFAACTGNRVRNSRTCYGINERRFTTTWKMTKVILINFYHLLLKWEFRF